MKQVLLFTLLWIPIIVNAQERPPITFSEVVRVDSVSKSDLFLRAREWFSQAFKSSKDVLNINDKEAGELSGKGIIPFDSRNFMGSAGTKGVIRFSVTIQVKDGRYKYTVTNFTHESTAISTPGYSFGLVTEDVECPYKIYMASRKWKNNIWRELQEKSTENGQAVVASIQNAMNKPNNKDNEW